MNKWLGIGRLTKDPEIKHSTGETANTIARFSLAVNRRFKNAEGTYDADFINCVAFGKTAEFIEKYFKKGEMMAVTARVQTGNYTNKDGIKVYTTDMVIEEVDFCGSKNPNSASEHTASTTASSTGALSGNDYLDIDDELPFA